MSNEEISEQEIIDHEIKTVLQPINTAYCLVCKMVQEYVEGSIVKTANNKERIKAKCSKCGKNISCFKPKDLTPEEAAEKQRKLEEKEKKRVEREIKRKAELAKNGGVEKVKKPKKRRAADSEDEDSEEEQMTLLSRIERIESHLIPKKSVAKKERSLKKKKASKRSKREE